MLGDMRHGCGNVMTRKFLRRCLNRSILSSLFALSLGCAVSCAPQHANDAMTTPERSIVHVSLEGESAKPDSAPKVVAGVSRVERYDGVLGSDGGECHQLISDEPLFEDNSAQSAYNKYSLGDFEEAAKSFEALVAKNALSSDDKQKALFLLGLIALKDPQKANNAVAMFKTARSIYAHLRRVAAD